MSTLYKANPIHETPQVEFWGCFDWSWTTENNGGRDVMGYYSAVPTNAEHNMEKVHYVEFKYKVPTRIWDMSHLCFERYEKSCRIDI